MTLLKIMKGLLIVTLLSCMSAHAAEDAVSIALEEGKQIAIFKVGDSRCVLKDDEVRCMPGTKQSTGEHSK